MGAGYDAGGKITPVLLRIQGNQIFADELATATAFPAAITFVAIDGITWPLNE
ncbi:hypothetical protein D3C86_1664560 [compost metagenome]